MDNRITKRRLSDMLAYDWILVIVVAIVGIIVWEFIYGIASVRLTVGQQFKYYYDINISSGSGDLYSLINDKNVFSYDVLSLSSESLTPEVNVLEARLSIQEGDVIVTDCVQPADDAEDKSVRLKTLVDVYYGYSYEQMLKDAKAYLSGYIKDGVADDISGSFNLDNLDKSKIELSFRDRMKKDNRFRKEEQILDGVQLEIERIEKLYKEVVKFDRLLSLKTSNPELFYCYTRYEQTRDSQANQGVYDDYDKIVQKEIDEGRGNNIYALKIAELTKFKNEGSGKKDPSEYFKVKGKDDASDVAIMVFNFREYQPHLQYEVISFINAIVEDCSNIYDVFN